MDNLIVADSTGTELRFLLYKSYDFEVGKSENTFEVQFLRSEYKAIPEGARIYIPGTEYGGIFRRLGTNTKQDIIRAGGLTWRGMMRKKIISPESGEDYATDTGELNEIIKARVEEAFPGVFVGSDADTGVSVTNYQYDRYCTLEAGLTKLLKTEGYKLELAYSQTLKAVVVSAVPIVDYSQQIELSSDMRTNYSMQSRMDGVNHLICLGKGELKDRDVYHWYVDENGNIDTAQHFFGADEIAEVFDYPGGELPDLIQSGRDRLESLMNTNKFDMQIDSDMEIGIGDIVGGRDYLSGRTMTSPITGKILTWSDGFQKIEYRLEDDVNVTVEPVSALTAFRAAKLTKEAKKE